MNFAPALESLATTAEVFSDPKKATSWAMHFFSLQPGKDLDSILYRLSQLNLNAEQLATFAVGLSNAADSWFLAEKQPAPKVVVQGFRQILRAEERLDQLQVQADLDQVQVHVEASIYERFIRAAQDVFIRRALTTLFEVGANKEILEIAELNADSRASGGNGVIWLRNLGL